MDSVTIAEVQAEMAASAEKLAAARVLAGAGFASDAISRAYYAVFHAATAALVAEGQRPNSHAAVRRLFGLLFVRQGRVQLAMAATLRNLADERQNGDYDASAVLTADEAESAIRRADEFRGAIRELLVRDHGFVSGSLP